MGDPDIALIAVGDQWNQRGYWEHRQVLNINERILAENGLAWGQIPKNLPLTVSAALKLEMEAFLDNFPEEFCCKDPRFVWTADIWASLAESTTIVAAFRNPSGFVKSISNVWPAAFDARRGLSEARSVELTIWEESNRRLLELSATYPCSWICFDETTKILKANLREIIGQLGKTLNEERFDEFFCPSLRHFSTRDEVHHRLIEPRYQELYNCLLLETAKISKSVSEKSVGHGYDMVVADGSNQLRSDSSGGLNAS